MDQNAASFGYRDVDPARKSALVRGVFDQVARRYDLMNDLMSGGLHRLWKDAAAARLNAQPGELIVDCAGGTGDMARRFSAMADAARRRRGGDAARVVAVDASFEMISAGRSRDGHRRDRRTDRGLVWLVGDAQALPLRNASADAYCIAFGLRNVTDIGVALSEARRVLKPGGRFVCLEFSKPVTGVVERLYDAYSFKLIPTMGAVVARNRQAYQYLVESIRRFPDQGRLAALMDQAGLAEVSVTNFSGGVCALHQGWAI
jgi:demethylmenaquinone methyltransferase/2-methoxy-6-polyprenyl-1,4-benzoquinol methylase